MFKTYLIKFTRNAKHPGIRPQGEKQDWPTHAGAFTPPRNNVVTTEGWRCWALLSWRRVDVVAWVLGGARHGVEERGACPKLVGGLSTSWAPSDADGLCGFH